MRKVAKIHKIRMVLVLVSGMMLVMSGCSHTQREEAVGAQPELRAVWVSVIGSGLKSPEEIKQLVDAVRRAHLNTIIAQVRRRGAVYFKSTLEPRGVAIQDRPDFDPLGVLLKEAHDTSGGKARIDVHAWFNVFAMGSQEDLMGAQPPPISATHPDWFTRNEKGEEHKELEPGVPAVQDHTIAVIEECVKQYEVDGVNLDFIRYFGRDMGYHPVALERFHRLSGRSDMPSADDEGWSDFRRAQITAFVRRCAATVWTHRPEALFTVDAVGFGRPPLQDFSDAAPYFQVFQDWAGWARKGYVDIVCRMGYKREHVAQQAEHFRGWADFSKRLQQESEGSLVTLGIGGYFNAPEGALAQYREALKRGLGTSLFSYHRPTRESSEKEQFGFASPFWDALGSEIYQEQVAPPRPSWRRDRATLAGFLKDSSGKAIDGGEVALVGTDHKTRSDGSGFFVFVNMKPGRYQLRAEGASVNGMKVECPAGKVRWIR